MGWRSGQRVNCPEGRRRLARVLWLVISFLLTVSVPSSNPRPPTVKTESGHEYLVLIHDPSSSILSVRLPRTDETSLSISGKIAIKSLREEQCFSQEKSLQWWNLCVSTLSTGTVFGLTSIINYPIKYSSDQLFWTLDMVKIPLILN